MRKIKKHLTTGPEGNSEFCFPRINVSLDEVKGNIEIRYCYIAKLNKAKVNFEKRAEIPATTSGHLQLNDLITCNSGQHFACNSELSPV